jgi:8-oxo-dGTP pyrophosphatase MutT (NUDIX family)
MPTPSGPIQQAAALPIWGGKVCLVTSRGGRRWVLPKGVVETDWTPAECAVQEAWEEAGLVGDLEPEPIGSYTYQKDGRNHHVSVYRLRVTQILNAWPECEIRRRVWLAPAEALWRIDIPELRNLLRDAFGEDDTVPERIAR